MQTGRKRGTSGRKRARGPGPGSLATCQKWSLRRLKMRWKRARERQMMVAGYEGDKGSWERGIRNVGTIWGKTDFFCWGLHAENLPRLSSRLK